MRTCCQAAQQLAHKRTADQAASRRIAHWRSLLPPLPCLQTSGPAPPCTPCPASTRQMQSWRLPQVRCAALCHPGRQRPKLAGSLTAALPWPCSPERAALLPSALQLLLFPSMAQPVTWQTPSYPEGRLAPRAWLARAVSAAALTSCRWVGRCRQHLGGRLPQPRLVHVRGALHRHDGSGAQALPGAHPGTLLHRSSLCPLQRLVLHCTWAPAQSRPSPDQQAHRAPPHACRPTWLLPAQTWPTPASGLPPAQRTPPWAGTLACRRTL